MGKKYTLHAYISILSVILLLLNIDSCRDFSSDRKLFVTKSNPPLNCARPIFPFIFNFKLIHWLFPFMIPSMLLPGSDYRLDLYIISILLHDWEQSVDFLCTNQNNPTSHTDFFSSLDYTETISLTWKM